MLSITKNIDRQMHRKNSMLRPKLFPRVAVAAIAAIIILAQAHYITRKPTIELSIGHLADKGETFSGQPMIISNAGMGDQSNAEFIIFRFKVPDQKPIVFMMSGRFINEKRTSRFSGTCVGVNRDVLSGCPIDPPFILVIGVKPLDDGESDNIR